MIARISSELYDRLLTLAAQAPGREVCGLLLGVEGAITALQPAANIAVAPADTFELDPAILFAALKAERAGGPRVLGHYHSHPSGTGHPSPRDAAMVHEAGRLWLIAGGGAIAAWRSAPGGSVVGAFEPVTLLIE